MMNATEHAKPIDDSVPSAETAGTALGKMHPLPKSSSDFTTQPLSVVLNQILSNIPFFAADTHTGLVRKNNEDSFVFCKGADGQPSFALVCDGIGGNKNGDIASSLVSRMALAAWSRFIRNSSSFSEETVSKFLSETFSDINNKVAKVNETGYPASPMGTTFAAAVFLEDLVVTANAGDSKVFSLHNGMMKQITVDHTVVAQLVRAGRLRPEDALDHPQAHVVTRAVGPVPDIAIEIKTADIHPGDSVLICSDGLTLHLDEGDIFNCLSQTKDPAGAVHQLIGEVLHRGGGDNVTVICARIPESPADDTSA